MLIPDLKLCVENLSQIEELLKDSCEKSSLTLNYLLSINGNLLPVDENRKLLHNLLESHGVIIRELASIDSFLQYCDLDSSHLTAEQQRMIIDCQATYSKIKESSAQIIDLITKTRTKINESGCVIDNDLLFKNPSQNASANYIENQTTITTEMVHDYQQYRRVLSQMHQELLFLDPRYMMEAAARRLDLGDKHTIHVETDHEMNILMDYGLFQCRQEGKNIIERYYQKYKNLYSGQKLLVLESLRNARMSLLKVIKPMGDNGLVVKDDFTNEALLMIDNGLYRLAKLHQNHAILTHYLVMPDFIITTGAATPVNLSSNSGMKMWKIFQGIISYRQNNNFDKNKAAYFQGITDLYKIIIHDNIAKQVSSKPLPMNYHSTLDQN